MLEKSVFLNKDFYFVYNIYISEKCLTQMGRKYIRDLFSLLQLNLLLNGKTFILHYMFKLYFFALKWPFSRRKFYTCQITFQLSVAFLSKYHQFWCTSCLV